jgi:L-fuconolactonase
MCEGGYERPRAEHAPPLIIKIDAHQHFRAYNAAEYGWIDDSMLRLRRDFLPRDLQKEIEAVGIDGVISVEARQSLAETRWLCELAAENSFVKGVVGWVPLVEDVKPHLETLAHCHVLKAVRHLVQDEPDDNFVLREDFNRGVDALGDFWLAYDLVIYERHLPQSIEFVDRHPHQTIVLDHLGKPRVRDKYLEPWATQIHKLAERENVYCKLSGLATEAHWQNWSAEELRPYWDVILQAFGPRRIMFGSDWPVCLLAVEYRSWYDLCRRFAAELSPAEQDRIFGGTAMEAYRLTVDH